MMSLSASLTRRPAQSGTSAVNMPSSSTGFTIGMPAAWHAVKSSSPNAGAMWTRPVPLSVVTWSAWMTWNAFGVSAKNGNSGR